MCPAIIMGVTIGVRFINGSFLLKRQQIFVTETLSLSSFGEIVYMFMISKLQ